MVKWTNENATSIVNFSLLLFSTFTPSKDQLRGKQIVTTSMYGSRNTHYYISTVYFINTGCGCIIQCCQTLNTFISKSGFSFVHHLSILSPWVFDGSYLFWFKTDTYCCGWALLESGGLSRSIKKDEEGPRKIHQWR